MLKQFRMFLIGNGSLVGFIKDGKQGNSGTGNFHTSDHPAAAAFSFSLRSDGKADLVTVVAQGCALNRLYLKVID